MRSGISRAARALAGGTALLALASIASCAQKEPPPPQGQQPSPNASIMPAPLASAGDLVGSHAASTASGGIPADSVGRLLIKEPEPLPPEAVSVNAPMPRDHLTSKDGIGVSLSAEWVWADLPPRPPIPELNQEGIKAATASTALKSNIDLAYAGRMRFELVGPAFPLPAHTEFRARTDFYGHVLVWPSGSAYRILSPGSVRAVFAERRPDVTPVVPGKPKVIGAGNLLGLKTQRVQITTNVGSITLEQAVVDGSGQSGGLLCRFLLELVLVEPSGDTCGRQRVPLLARYEWVDGGSLSFKVDEMVNRLDLPLAFILVPPAGADFTPGDMPPQASGVFLSREQLAKFRTKSVPRSQPAPAGAPGEGLHAFNHTDTLRYLLLDGVPVAWVTPYKERYIIGPQSGRYSIAWRDFFGTSIQPPALIELPARVELGSAADGGEP